METTGTPVPDASRTGLNRLRDRWTAEDTFLALIFSVVGLGMIIASAVSYQHEYTLARANGQVRWVSALVPFTLDGMIFVSGGALLWAGMYGVRGWRRLWVPVAVMLTGIAATIAANYYSDVRTQWLGPAVSASSGVAVVLMSAVAFWLLGEVRRHARKADPVAPPDHVCAPPPLTVADALARAKAYLKEAGEPYGEEAIAKRFSMTRHELRRVLTAPVETASANGHPHG